MGDFGFQSPFGDLPDFSPDNPFQPDWQIQNPRSHALSQTSCTPPPHHLDPGLYPFDMSSMRINCFMSDREDPYVPGHNRPTFGHQRYFYQNDGSQFRRHDSRSRALMPSYPPRLNSPHETNSSMSSCNDWTPASRSSTYHSEFDYNVTRSPILSTKINYFDSGGAGLAYQQATTTLGCLQDIQITPDHLPEQSVYPSVAISTSFKTLGGQNLSSLAPSSYAEESFDDTRSSGSHDDISTEHEDVEDETLSSHTKTEDNDSDYKPTARRVTRKRRADRSDDCSDTCVRPTKKRSPSAIQNSASVDSKSLSVATITTKEGIAERQFPCLLRSYGCCSTFTSKNEWKRHITTQHLCFRVWRCDLCPASTARPNDFNRKDLFAQHLKRMHSQDGIFSSPKGAPSKISHGGTRSKDDRTRAASDDLDNIFHRCSTPVRAPPPKLTCTFCKMTFQSHGNCEDWLEHVGRHLLSLSKGRHPAGNHKGDDGQGDGTRWADDEYFKRWLVSQGMLDGKTGKLVKEDKGRFRESISKQSSANDDAAGNEE